MAERFARYSGFAITGAFFGGIVLSGNWFWFGSGVALALFVLRLWAWREIGRPLRFDRRLAIYLVGCAVMAVLVIFVVSDRFWTSAIIVGFFIFVMVLALFAPEAPADE